MIRRAPAVGLVVVVLLLAGCSDGEDAVPTESTPSQSATPTEPVTGPATPSETASEEPTPAAQVIEITVEGDSVSPDGDRIEVGVDEPIELAITADAPGEIHVHSSPEQEFSYDAGSSRLRLVIDKPGLVDVESHTLGVVIVQLEVRP